MYTSLCGIKKIQKINMYAVQSGKRSKTFPCHLCPFMIIVCKLLTKTICATKTQRIDSKYVSLCSN